MISNEFQLEKKKIMARNDSSNSTRFCWAETLGDCKGKISREHLVSKSYFDDKSITVEGFSWCKDAPKTIGISSLTSKVLCEHHNTNLSPLDAECGNAIKIFREWHRLAKARERVKEVRLPVKRYTINADLLERWFLKTLINLACGGEYPIGFGGTEKGKPIRELVDTCFRLKTFNGKAGMYVSGRVGQNIHTGNTLECTTIISAKKEVICGLFKFFGFHFILTLSGRGVPTQVPGVGEEWARNELLRPIQAIKSKREKRLSQVIEFSWD